LELLVPTTTADRLVAVPADFTAADKEGASILPRAATRARPPLLPAVVAVASIGAIMAA